MTLTQVETTTKQMTITGAATRAVVTYTVSPSGASTALKAYLGTGNAGDGVVLTTDQATDLINVLQAALSYLTAPTTTATTA